MGNNLCGSKEEEKKVSLLLVQKVMRKSEQNRSSQLQREQQKEQSVKKQKESENLSSFPDVEKQDRSINRENKQNILITLDEPQQIGTEQALNLRIPEENNNQENQIIKCEGTLNLLQTARQLFIQNQSAQIVVITAPTDKIQEHQKIECLLVSKPKQQGVTLDNFDQYEEIGKGGYGKVLKVKQQTGRRQQYMALKQIEKSKLRKQNLKACALLEKNILLKNNHPYIIKMHYSWQDSLFLYICMQYCEGGEIYGILKQIRRFSEPIAKMIISEVIIALQHLHQQMKIMYRDIKPENILVTQNGHVKLADFGLSKQFENPNDRAYTYVGTYQYLAPEIILTKDSKRGYDKAIDLWAIGVLLYEFIRGRSPFSHDTRDYAAIKRRILENKPEFNQKLFSTDSQDLILNLLQSEPQERIGYKSFADIKAHPFFKDVDWDEIENSNFVYKEGPLQSILDQYLSQMNKTRPENPCNLIKPVAAPLNSEEDNPDRICGFTYNGSLGLTLQEKFQLEAT